MMPMTDPHFLAVAAAVMFVAYGLYRALRALFFDETV